MTLHPKVTQAIELSFSNIRIFRISILFATLCFFGVNCIPHDPHSGLSFNCAGIQLDRELNELVGKVRSGYSVEKKSNGDSLSKLTIFDMNGSCICLANVNNINGRLVYDTIWTRICMYDSAGYITKSMMFKPGQLTASAITYKYDQYGNPLEEDRYNSSINYTYLRKGNHIEMTRTEGTHILDKTILDKRGRRIEYLSDRVKQTFDKQGRLMGHYERYDAQDYKIDEVYKHNKWGYIAEISYPESDRIVKVIYSKFDSIGNWIERKWITSGRDICDTAITIREITYHEE
jgi:hypothetical protein